MLDWNGKVGIDSSEQKKMNTLQHKQAEGSARKSSGVTLQKFTHCSLLFQSSGSQTHHLTASSSAVAPEWKISTTSCLY